MFFFVYLWISDRMIGSWIHSVNSWIGASCSRVGFSRRILFSPGLGLRPGVKGFVKVVIRDLPACFENRVLVTNSMDQLAIMGGQPVRDNKIYYGRQCIEEDDIQAVLDTLRSPYVTCGPKVAEMEK